MTNNSILSFFILVLFSFCSFSQTDDCDGTLPFEEKNGLLTIEMESGILNDTRWKTGIEGDTEYIFWDGPQSFNALTNAKITYKIKINTTGTYRFAWRMKVGLGTSKGEHNDAWLKIDADDFYGIKAGAKVYPKPLCNSDANLTCAAGSSVDGFMKAFGNQLEWTFVTNTNDGDSHRVFVTFNNPGIYTITVDARSSYCFIDKMVLRKDGIADATAFNLSNNESTCYNESLSVKEEHAMLNEVKVYPNPSSDKIEITNLKSKGNLLLSNVFGAVVLKTNYNTSSKEIDISNLKSGVYFISNSDKNNYFFKKVIKF